MVFRSTGLKKSTTSNQYLTRRPTGDLKVKSPGLRDIETG